VVAIANKLARIAWAVEKTLRLESRERFPLSHRHDDEALE